MRPGYPTTRSGGDWARLPRIIPRIGYKYNRPPPGTRTLIEGHIESVGDQGIVHGWLRDTDSRKPCHVQILHGGRLVAEALAAEFRADLLRAGHGHGHHGFAARLHHALPPGPGSLVLHLPATGLSASMPVTIGVLQPPVPQPVEALLQPVPGWTVADLLSRPDCLAMAACHQALGTPRFVDGVFRFVLDRWPSAAEARLHAASLAAGRITPQGVLVELLASRERADMPPALISPYDPDFPFSGAAS